MKSFFNRFATLTGSRPFATFTNPRVPELTLNESFRSPLTPTIPSNSPRRSPRTFKGRTTKFPEGRAATTKSSPGFACPFPRSEPEHTPQQALLQHDAET